MTDDLETLRKITGAGDFSLSWNFVTGWEVSVRPGMDRRRFFKGRSATEAVRKAVTMLTELQTKEPTR